MTARHLTDFPRATVIAEVEALERTQTLARSPMMRRLLRYLIDESLAGRGAKIKSYTVAVEGLGRSENFDSHTDSYPRVQAGRLRRLLELHYLRHPHPATGLQLQIAAVGYEVMVARGLDRTDEGDERQIPARPAEPVPTVDTLPLPPSFPPSQANTDSALSGRWRLPIIGAVVAGVTALAMLTYLVIAPMLRASPVDPGDVAPSLTVVVTGGSGVSERNAVRGWVLGSLAPSWLYRLTDVDDPARIPPAARSASERAYRLTINIAGPQPSNYQFVLVDSKTSQVVWSTNVRAPSPLVGERTALDPPITRLSSPNGIIAKHERIALRDSPMGLYRCALTVEDYILAPTPQLRPIVLACTDAGLRRQPHNIQLLVTKAVLGFNRNDPLSDLTETGFARTYAMVRQAAERDPNDPRTAMIQARYYFLSGDCPRGIARAEDAVKGWPHSARFWGLSGFYLFECADPRGPDFVRNAVRLEGRSMNMYEAVLMFDALDRGDIAAANTAAINMNAADRRVDMFRTLNLAVLHAANGRQGAARRYWSQFAAAVDVDQADRTAVFDAYRTGERQRRIAERYLSQVL